MKYNNILENNCMEMAARIWL